MKEWIEIHRPVDIEADIPLEDQAPDIVKNAYSDGHKDKFIAWVTGDGKLMGCIKNNRSISAHVSEASEIELYEMEPAKGGGYVGLQIKSSDGGCLAVVATARYSQQSLAWLRQVQTELASIFNLEAAYQYDGKDA